MLGGCDFAADPALSIAQAKVFWSAEFAFDVLILAALPEGLTGASRSALPRADADALVGDGSHVLLDLGGVAQLWLAGPPDSAAALGLLIPLGDGLPVRLGAALDLWRRMNGQAPERERLTAQQRRRLIDGLRALDARQDGASYRAITRALFPAFELSSRAEWKDSALRAQTMRLVADATALMRGGYRDLLRRGRPAR